jgi:hypothetical protein
LEIIAAGTDRCTAIANDIGADESTNTAGLAL